MNIKKLNIKKVLLKLNKVLVMASLSASVFVYAENVKLSSDLELKISGYGHFQNGYLKQDPFVEDQNNNSLISNNKFFTFFNDSALFADLSKKVDDVTYGGKIVLLPTAKRKAGTYGGSHIYLESCYGRIEAGSPIDAANALLIDSSKIAAGTGYWHMYAKVKSAKLYGYSPYFATGSQFFVDNKAFSSTGSMEPARKVSYYSPNFCLKENTNLRFAISYTPNSLNTGSDDLAKELTKLSVSSTKDQSVIFEIDNCIKNIFSGGLVLEKNISEGVDLKLALTGEWGKASKVVERMISNNDVVNTYPLKDLRSFNIGAILNSGNMVYVASFGSLGKSLTFPKQEGKTTYYTGGLGYKQGPFSTSLTYFHANKCKNITNCFTLASDYKLTTNFRPYAEISIFDCKGKENIKRKGKVFLVGAKISI